MSASSPTDPTTASPLDIGFLLLGSVPVKESVELAVLAEAHGLSSVWLSEDGFLRTAIPVAALIGASTTQITIGTAVVNPYVRPPVWLAMEAATLDEVTGGRLVLGIGASWRPTLEPQGIPWTRPLSAVRETTAVLRTLLEGEEARIAGEVFQITGVRLGFSPVSHVPIYIGAMFPASLAQTGQIADGVIVSLMCPLPYLRSAVALVVQGAVSAGRRPDALGVVYLTPTLVHHDGDAARRGMKRWLAMHIEHSFRPQPSHWRKIAEIGAFDLDEWAWIDARLAEGAHPEQVVNDGFVDRFALAGTPAACVERVREYGAAGATEVVACWPVWANAREQIRHLGTIAALLAGQPPGAPPGQTPGAPSVPAP